MDKTLNRRHGQFWCCGWSIESNTDRSATYDFLFLLVIHSNHDPVSYRFWEKGRFRSKRRKFFLPPVFTVVVEGLIVGGGFLSSDLLNKTDSVLRKAHKFGYTTEVLKVTDMLQNADNELFSLMFWSGHCLHTLLPDLKVIDIVLRNSGTSFNLPHCSYKLYKQSFVNRCLFRDCYWHVLLCGTLYAIWSDLICYHFSPHNGVPAKFLR